MGFEFADAVCFLFLFFFFFYFLDEIFNLTFDQNKSTQHWFECRHVIHLFRLEQGLQPGFHNGKLDPFFFFFLNLNFSLCGTSQMLIHNELQCGTL